MTTTLQIQRLPQTTGCFDADRATEIPLGQFSQKIPPNTTSRDMGGLKWMNLAARWKRIRLVLLQWELLQIQSAGINSRYIEHAYFRHDFPYLHVNLNVVSQLYTHTRTQTHTHSMDFLRYWGMKVGRVAQSVQRLSYGLDGLGIESRWGEIFHPSRPALRPTQPPVQLVTGLSRGKVRPGSAAGHSPLLVPWSWKSRAIPLPTLWATTGPVTGTLYLFQGMKEFGDEVRSEQGNSNFSSSNFHFLTLRSL